MTYYTIAYKSDGTCCPACQPDPSTCSCEGCCDCVTSYTGKRLYWSSTRHQSYSQRFPPYFQLGTKRVENYSVPYSGAGCIFNTTDPHTVQDYFGTSYPLADCQNYAAYNPIVPDPIVTGAYFTVLCRLDQSISPWYSWGQSFVVPLVDSDVCINGTNSYPGSLSRRETVDVISQSSSCYAVAGHSKTCIRYYSAVGCTGGLMELDYFDLQYSSSIV